MLPSLVPALGRVLGYAVSEGMAHISVRIRCRCLMTGPGTQTKIPYLRQLIE